MKQYPFNIHRRVVANKTLEGWEGTPHVSILVDLDVTELVPFVRRLSQHPDFAEVRVTINSVMLKIIAEGMKHSPEMNAHIQYDASTSIGSMSVSDEVHIATPMLARDKRMITPVVKHVNRKSLREICLDMEDIKRRMRNTDTECLLYRAALQDTLRRLREGQWWMTARRLSANLIGRARLSSPTRAQLRAYARASAKDQILPEELLNATTLVSNIGGALPEARARFGLLEIIPPQTCAIGLASIQRQPLAITREDGSSEVAVRDVLPMSVCFDHRAMDFEHSVGFLREITRLSTRPEELASLG